jgi:hypothetical protein
MLMKSRIATIASAAAIAVWALATPAPFAGATESPDERIGSEEAASEAPSDEAAEVPSGQAAEPSASGAAKAPAAPAPAAQSAGPEGEEFGEVVRASFATAVEGREPVDQVTTLGSDHDHVFFFTELQGFEGRTLEHVWERDGAEMARVSFYVGGPRWRFYSSKKLDPEWTGEWSVTVVDESGRELHQEGFSYVRAEESLPASMDEEAPPASME